MSMKIYGKIFRIPLLVAILVALYIVSKYVPFPVSWLIHFLFAFALTLLIYKNLLNRSYTKLFLSGMIMLMVLWEIYEWAKGGRISKSVFLTGVDTTLDLVFGLLGTLLAIRASHFAWL